MIHVAEFNRKPFFLTILIRCCFYRNRYLQRYVFLYSVLFALSLGILALFSLVPHVILGAAMCRGSVWRNLSSKNGATFLSNFVLYSSILQRYSFVPGFVLLSIRRVMPLPLPFCIRDSLYITGLFPLASMTSGCFLPSCIIYGPKSPSKDPFPAKKIGPPSCKAAPCRTNSWFTPRMIPTNEVEVYSNEVEVYYTILFFSLRNAVQFFVFLDQPSVTLHRDSHWTPYNGHTRLSGDGRSPPMC